MEEWNAGMMGKWINGYGARHRFTLSGVEGSKGGMMRNGKRVAELVEAEE